MSIKKYTVLFIFFSIFITFILLSINYIVDPYMVFQSKRISSFNDKKPAAANRSALYKPYNITNVQPKTIIVGNSRPEMGIDPNSTCWPSDTGTVYNLTFPGQSTYNQTLALFHAVSKGQIKRILLAVDFSDFLHKKRKHEKAFWPNYSSDFTNRLLVDAGFQENKKYWSNKIKDFSAVLFSLNVLNDSIYTLMSQSENSTTRTDLGFNPAKDYLDIVRYEGAWVLFEQKQDELRKRFLKKELTIHDSNQWSEELEAIKRAVQLSIDKNIQLIIFINPYHYTYLETIRNAGYWNEFETFKKSLTRLLDQYGNNQVMLWDFSLYSSYTVSSIPKKNITTRNFHWFWEPAHYKSELGELMLAEMFGGECRRHTLPVGIELNDKNIGAHLIQQMNQRSILLQKL